MVGPLSNNGPKPPTIVPSSLRRRCVRTEPLQNPGRFRHSIRSRRGRPLRRPHLSPSGRPPPPANALSRSACQSVLTTADQFQPQLATRPPQLAASSSFCPALSQSSSRDPAAKVPCVAPGGSSRGGRCQQGRVGGGRGCSGCDLGLKARSEEH